MRAPGCRRSGRRRRRLSRRFAMTEHARAGCSSRGSRQAVRSNAARVRWLLQCRRHGLFLWEPLPATQKLVRPFAA